MKSNFPYISSKWPKLCAMQSLLAKNLCIRLAVASRPAAAAILSLALILVSCGDKPDAPVPPGPGASDAPLEFSASMASTTESRSLDPLEDKYTVFRAFATKRALGTDQVVLPGYYVSFDVADGWFYDTGSRPAFSDPVQYLKYWDGDAFHYDFCAYAPTDPTDAAERAAVTASSVNAYSRYFQAHLPYDASAVYPLAAHTHRYVKDTGGQGDIDAITDERIPATGAFTYSSTVPLRFHHIFSQVQFRVFNSGGAYANVTNLVVELDDPAQHFFASGTFTGTDGWVTTYEDWEPNNRVAQADGPFSIPGGGDAGLAVTLTNNIEVPQSLEGKDFSISMVIDGTPVGKTFTFDRDWEVDKIYIYYISFVTSDQRPIFVDVSVEEFLYGDIINNTQTNW